jgi:hypothetical protein
MAVTISSAESTKQNVTGEIPLRSLATEAQKSAQQTTN